MLHIMFMVMFMVVVVVGVVLYVVGVTYLLMFNIKHSLGGIKHKWFFVVSSHQLSQWQCWRSRLYAAIARGLMESVVVRKG